MPNDETSNPTTPDEINSILEQENKKKLFFSRQLDEQRQKSNHLLAISSEMGGTRSFITSVTLKWINTHVRFAKEAPIWANKKDKKTDRLIIDGDTLEKLLQREPDWRRQIEMTRYIATHETHKFPPMLIVAWKPWVNDPQSDKWIDGRAGENSITEFSLDSEGAYIDLDYEATEFYALDGQHRLMAIQGLNTLIGTQRQLHSKNEYGHPKNQNPFTLESAMDELTLRTRNKVKDPNARIQSLMQEKIGVEIIPAIQKNETLEAGQIRLRNIFVHVNQTAKRLTKGEIALLNEDDGFSIVARRAMVQHELLNNDRVDKKNGQLSERSKPYTTLETLVSITKKYVGRQEPFARWKTKAAERPIRPHEEELDSGLEILMSYFNLLSQLPSHKSLIQDHGKSAGEYRSDKGKLAAAENILFRPIAQEALAEALAELAFGEKKLNLDGVIKKIIKNEQEGNLRLRQKTSIWFGVLCDVNQQKMRRHDSYKKLCCRLFLHLLGGGTPEEIRKEVEDDFQKARMLDEKSYIDLDGKTKSGGKLELPRPW